MQYWLSLFSFFLDLRRCEELKADGGVEPLPGGDHHELVPKQHGQLPQPQHLRVSLQRFHQVFCVWEAKLLLFWPCDCIWLKSINMTGLNKTQSHQKNCHSKLPKSHILLIILGTHLKSWSPECYPAGGMQPKGARSQSLVQHFSQTDVTLPTSHHHHPSWTKDLFHRTTDDFEIQEKSTSLCHR